MKISRVTVFAGHYGSGKTNLAINYANWLKNILLKENRDKTNVVICDLDIVNPYFRTSDSLVLLEKMGIELISSKYSNSNVDLPSIPSNVQSVFDNKDIYAAIDLGGDDRGALALGRYSKNIIRDNNYEMLLVVNKYRPMSSNIKGLTEIKDEIENAAKVPFTGIVNNCNLGEETTLQDVLNTFEFIKELSKEIKLPVKMTTVNYELINSLRNHQMMDVFPIKIYKKQIWKI